MWEEWFDACSTDDSNTTKWGFVSEEPLFSYDPLPHPLASQKNPAEGRVVRQMIDTQSPEVGWYDKAFLFLFFINGNTVHIFLTFGA